MRKRELLASAFAILMAVPCAVVGEDKVEVDWYGFVNVQSYSESHESATGAGGMLYLYPLDRQLDAQGNDLRAHSQYVMFGTTARFGGRLKGPQVLGAASSGNFELEFMGYSGVTNPVLFRHAFFALDWADAKVTLGQTWHPMGDVIPYAVSIAIGSPFAPMSRTPQLRYDYFLADRSIKLTAAAVYQQGYPSTGMHGRTNEYQKNVGIPELYAGVEYRNGGFAVTAGGEWQRLAARIQPFTELVDAFAGMFRVQYATDGFSIKAQTLYGQNMSNLGICSGYAVSKIDPLTFKSEWTPLLASSSWFMLTVGNEVKFNLIGGYMKNLGCNTNILTDKVYAIGTSSAASGIDQMYRVAPSFTYRLGNIDLGAEFEYTSVAYGNYKSNGTVADTHWVDNKRLLVSAIYNF